MVSGLNCIIIDDDEMSRKIIEKYVNRTDFLRISHTYSSAVEAINHFNTSEQVDLVFLDIEMPEMNGYDFLNTLDHPVHVIIISSKEKYALEAFEYNVIDYLLKPIHYSRFYKAVEKSHKRIIENREIREGVDAIFVKQESKLVRVRYDEIIWIEALENYVVISTMKDKFVIHFTMKAIESKLPENKFSRVHRSYIVNKDKIKEIADNSLLMDVEDKAVSIPIGKSYREKLMNDINLMNR